MIQRARIKNFRSCQDTVIDDLGGLVALIGHNGAGKSNILLAISLASGSASSPSQLNIAAFHPVYPGKLFEVELDFECDGKKYRYDFQFGLTEGRPPRWHWNESLSRFEKNGPIPLVTRSGSDVKIHDRGDAIKIGELAACLPALATLLPATDAAIPEVKSVLSFLSAIRYYPIDEPAMRLGAGTPLMANIYNAWLTTFESTGNPQDSVLARLVYMSEKRPDDFGVLKSWLGRGKLGLIDDIKIQAGIQNVPTGQGTPPKQEIQYYFVQFLPSREEGINTSHVMAEGLSAGTRRVLKILVSAIFDQSAVMLLEQPEDSLHQGLTKNFIGLIQTNVDLQIIMSSHSSALLNKLRPENVRIVSLHDGFTVARQLTESEQEIAVKFLNDQGPLYDFFEPLQ
jgi:predicted ATPase